MRPSIPSRSDRRGRRRLALAAACALALGLSGEAVRAERPPPSAAARGAARSHFARGRAAQAAGAYDRAVTEYLAAYEQVPDALLLFNVGQAYRLGGNLRKALTYYRLYLEAAPDGRASDQARQYVTRLALALETAPPAGARADEPAATAAAPASAPPRPTRRPRARRPSGAIGSAPGQGRALRTSGLLVAAAGLVALGVGAKLGLDARARERDAERLVDDTRAAGQPWSAELDARERELLDEGDAADRRALLLLGAGGAALVVGGTLFAIGALRGRAWAEERARASAPPPRLATAPLLGVGVAGLAVAGRF